MVFLLSTLLGTITGTTTSVIVKLLVAILICGTWLIAGILGGHWNPGSLVAALVAYNVGLFLPALPAIVRGFSRA